MTSRLFVIFDNCSMLRCNSREDKKWFLYFFFLSSKAVYWLVYRFGGRCVCCCCLIRINIGTDQMYFNKLHVYALLSNKLWRISYIKSYKNCIVDMRPSMSRATELALMVFNRPFCSVILQSMYTFYLSA